MWAAERVSRGAGWGELSRELGIPAKTLERWAGPRAEPAVALRPVDVVDAGDTPPDRTVTIVSPSGLRIEGVTIADVITILRGLA